MNSLSWLIYAIELFSTIKGLAGGFSVVFVIIFTVTCIAYIISKIDYSDLDAEQYYWGLSIMKRVAYGTVFFLILYTFIPSSKTMTLIAASEIGEKFVNSQKAGQVVDKIVDPSINLLNKYIQEQIDFLDKKVEKK